jgi:glutamate N-acetyltransferase/amino-acid N-acetyltransferase
MSRLAAAVAGCEADDVAVCSTGVIGRPLPMERIREGLPRIELRPDGGFDLARAIMTTDTRPKHIAAAVEADGRRYTVGGIAKGSGMIHPDMATMLGFMTTDAAVDGALLQTLLSDAVEDSFNMITIDGDTSPEDMVVLLANGATARNGDVIDAGHAAAPLLRAALQHVAVTLSRKLARDGEGAGKLLEVRVDGAASADDARLAAKAIVGSLLVKTAVYGNDPNWGRVLVAAGYSGAELDEPRTSLSIQDVEVYRDGAGVEFDPAALSAGLQQTEVRFRLDLGLGEGSATAWGCDLTPEYVRINSEYTT